VPVAVVVFVRLSDLSPFMEVKVIFCRLDTPRECVRVREKEIIFSDLRRKVSGFMRSLLLLPLQQMMVFFILSHSDPYFCINSINYFNRMT
jgi:hypothetical protein